MILNFYIAPSICGRGVTLTPHPLLVPRSKIEYSYTSIPPKGLRGLWKGETYQPSLWMKVNVQPGPSVVLKISPGPRTCLDM